MLQQAGLINEVSGFMTDETSTVRVPGTAGFMLKVITNSKHFIYMSLNRGRVSHETRANTRSQPQVMLANWPAAMHCAPTLKLVLHLARFILELC